MEERDGGYWVTGTRISLDSIVAAFNRGAAPETIRRSFPLLSLEEVYGAITFYLAHESQIDQYLRESNGALDAQAAARHEQLRASKPELYDRILRAVAEGVADSEGGRVVDHKKVRLWLESWGADREKDPPQ